MASMEQSLEKNKTEETIFSKGEIKRIVIVTILTFALRELISQIFNKK